MNLATLSYKGQRRLSFCETEPLYSAEKCVSPPPLFLQ